ncbi:ABC transporter permease subunit [Microbacterium sp. 4R-513]|uniref:ABC transporter permease n=1 Tax=Microbacterium sp. 4R-513 TaxID=2567934 RepID=UPI0013E11285|nr:ABC transporter permease subunit [Microbacterium sp. 4R-513]QIG40838.1 ABC transporter permease subunit [Microbacterium sp. 4R-513]
MSSPEAVRAPAKTAPSTVPPVDVASRGSGLPGLLGSEAATLFRRWRTWAMLGALALVPVLLAVAVRIAGGADPGGGPPFLDQITDNGVFVGLAALTVAIPLFLPLTISVVSGDAIAGEASLGTLRYLLVAPSGRSALLVVKYVVAAVFCVAATFTVVAIGVLVGGLLFGAGPVTLLSGAQVSLGEGLLRCLAVVAYVSVSMLGLSAIGVLLSTLTTVPVGAMAATAILAVAAQIVGQIPQLSAIHPFLFTDKWLDFGDLLRSPISWDSFAENAVLQAAWIVAAGALALWRFGTRDVLS